MKTFNTEEHISCFTQYNMAVQPSIVIHWKTVSMANPMLSKLVMPKFGPSQRSRHIETFASHTWAPSGCSTSLSALHGLGSSPSFTIISATSSVSKISRIKASLLNSTEIPAIEIHVFSNNNNFLIIFLYDKMYSIYSLQQLYKSKYDKWKI